MPWFSERLSFNIKTFIENGESDYKDLNPHKSVIENDFQMGPKF